MGHIFSTKTFRVLNCLSKPGLLSSVCPYVSHHFTGNKLPRRGRVKREEAILKWEQTTELEIRISNWNMCCTFWRGKGRGGKARGNLGSSVHCSSGKERGRKSLPEEQTPQTLYNILNLQSSSINKPFN